MSARTTNWPQVIRVALLAGLAGGIVIDAFLYVVTLLPQHGSILSIWQYVASTLVGKIAFSSLNWAFLGLVAHFFVSIGWAGGYAYLAQQRTFMDERWVVSGLVYGFVVYLFMQIVLIASNNFMWPSGIVGWLVPILAHMVFFGMPVALVTARLSRET